MRLTTIRWSLQHGIPRTALKLAARHDDPLATMLVDVRARANPQPYFDRIRADGPMSRGRLMYVTASHPAARQVLRSDAFGVGDAFAAYPKLVAKALQWSQDPAAIRATDAPSMSAVDDPQHSRYRRLVSRAFTARAIERMRDRVEEVCARTLDDLAGEPSVDLVPAFAYRIPITVIASILGVSDRELPVLEYFGPRLSGSLDAGQPLRQYRRTDADVRAFNSWFDGHLERLRRDPGDDLLSGLVTPEHDDDRLSPLELHTLGGLLLNAGFMTTTTLLATGADLLIRHPEQRERLVAEPDRWPNAIDEILRMDAPVRLSARTCMTDTEVQGVPIAAGSRVIVLMTAANHDPEVFADPGRFDITRENAHDHLSFSVGRHFCIGSGLARMEGQLALRGLFERFPDLAIAPGSARKSNWALSSWKSLPVTHGDGRRPSPVHRAAAGSAGLFAAASSAPVVSSASSASSASVAEAAARGGCPFHRAPKGAAAAGPA